MRIVVVGAGAMGSLFASHLAGTGEEVWVYDVWREHVEAIRRTGLTVIRAGAAHVVRLRATADPREPGLADLLLVFVKHRHTRQAVADARPMIGPETTAVTLQNGIGNAELLEAAVPAARILRGLTTLTSELRGPGQIEASFRGPGETYLWPLGGRPDARAEAACGLLARAGIHAELAPDIERRIWQKLVVNCGLNTVCALTGLKVGELCDQADAWPLLDGIVDEIAEVASRKGIPLDAGEGRRFLRRVAEEARAHVPSMLVDVRQGRPTEIDCLNGAVIREGERAGVATPYNRAVTSLIRLLEGGGGRGA